MTHIQGHRRPPLGLIASKNGLGPLRGGRVEHAQGHHPCRRCRRIRRRDDTELDQPGPVGRYPGLAFLLVCVRDRMVAFVVVVDWGHFTVRENARSEEWSVVFVVVFVEDPTIRRGEKNEEATTTPLF